MISIRTLSDASMQSVFTQLAEYLVAMDAPCLQANGVIGAYHFGDRRSPAGSLVADEDYLISMEGRNWWKLAQDGVVPEAHAELIEEIEYIHDSFSPESWEIYLIEMAKRYRLNHPFRLAA